jgi:hypothetical protein
MDYGNDDENGDTGRLDRKAMIHIIIWAIVLPSVLCTAFIITVALCLMGKCCCFKKQFQIVVNEIPNTSAN